MNKKCVFFRSMASKGGKQNMLWSRRGW